VEADALPAAVEPNLAPGLVLAHPGLVLWEADLVPVLTPDL
jgi:hypothetical protein